MTDAKQPQSITVWFDELKRGSPDAAEQLWNRLFGRLVDYARTRMSGIDRRVSDEEDIAIGVMAALCEAAERNRLPSIEGREDLWRMLLRWTRNDVFDQRRYQEAAKRGGGDVRGESAIRSGDTQITSSLDRFVSDAHPADVLHEMSEQFTELLQRLPDDVLRTIAIDRLHGYQNEEVAVRLGVSTRTVERKLRLIRGFWT